MSSSTTGLGPGAEGPRERFRAEHTGGAISTVPVMPVFGEVDGYVAARSAISVQRVRGGGEIPFGEKVRSASRATSCGGRSSPSISRQTGGSRPASHDWRAICPSRRPTTSDGLFPTGSTSTRTALELLYSVNPNGLVAQPFMAAYTCRALRAAAGERETGHLSVDGHPPISSATSGWSPTSPRSTSTRTPTQEHHGLPETRTAAG